MGILHQQNKELAKSISNPWNIYNIKATAKCSNKTMFHNYHRMFAMQSLCNLYFAV